LRDHNTLQRYNAGSTRKLLEEVSSRRASTSVCWYKKKRIKRKATLILRFFEASSDVSAQVWTSTGWAMLAGQLEELLPENGSKK
jgi:hypothetical protein